MSKNDDNNYVTTFGLVRDIDTSGMPVDEAWADEELYFKNPRCGLIGLGFIAIVFLIALILALWPNLP